MMLLPKLVAALAILPCVTGDNVPLTNVRKIDGSDRADLAGAAEDYLLRLSPDKVTYTGDGSGATVWDAVNARDISNTMMNEPTPKLNKRGLLDMVS